MNILAFCEASLKMKISRFNSTYIDEKDVAKISVTKDRQNLKKFSYCPFKSCDTTLRPIELKSGPLLVRAKVKLFLRRAAETVEPEIFAQFSSAWPHNKKGSFPAGPTTQMFEKNA
jgi:hypothetical protein